MTTPRSLSSVPLVVCLGLLPMASSAHADLSENGPPTMLRRLSGPVAIDGAIDETAWKDAALVDTWWETNPGNNVEPAVKNLAWVGYDDDYLYAAFDFADPEPMAIRAPLGDRDDVGSPTDYGGLILDPRGDGKGAQMFLANAAGRFAGGCVYGFDIQGLNLAQ